jgi:hypothetical protein
LRLAAGICVLSAGLLIGSAGGGIASADDSTDSAPQSSVDGAGSAATSASEPAASATTPTPSSAFQKTVTNTLTLIGKLHQQQAEATKRLLTRSQTVSETETVASDSTGEAVIPLALDTEVAPAITEVAPVTDPAAR